MAYQYPLAVSAIVSLLAYLVYIKILRQREVSAFGRKHGCLKPPSSPKSGYIGWRELLDIHTKLKAKKLLEEQVRKYAMIGNTYTVSVLTQTVILTIEPENIKAILANRFDDFGLGLRLDFFTPLLTGGIFVSDGESWKHSRALVRPAFTRNQVANLEQFETHAQGLIAKIPKDGSTIDLGPLFSNLALDQASEYLLGQSVNSQNGDDDSPQARFGVAFDYAASKQGHWGTTGITSYIWTNRRYFKDIKTIHNFVGNIVQNARDHQASRSETEKLSHENEKPESGRYVFVDELAKATDHPTQMRNELLSVLIAGRDTTASMLTSSFNILAKCPDIYTKLRAEAEFLGGEPPDYETLRNLKYLKYFLNESRDPL